MPLLHRAEQANTISIMGLSFVLSALCMTLALPATAQAPVSPDPPAGDDEATPVPEQIEVEPIAADDEIARRLLDILEATPWFADEAVEVKDGVVFLRGTADSEAHEEWAEAMAQRTRDVVAVVNLMNVETPRVWDFSPSLQELRRLWAQSVQIAPLIALGLIILLLTWMLAALAARFFGWALRSRVQNPLLRGVAVKFLAAIVLILGIYIVLRVAGLTRLAVTVLGGTGLLGLVLGIAFRDIAENFLASLLISIQTPFRTGDVIEIEGNVGVVQKVTTRGTLLMAFNGNYVQIPNSTVYKTIIRNHTASRNTRYDFTIGVAYDTPIAQAQETAMRALQDHPAVLNDPEPMVLVEALGSATITIRVYFWVDVVDHSPPKVKSSVMRLVLRALEEVGVEMPDEAREVIFPKGIPVHLLQESMPASSPAATPVEQEDAVSTEAEGGLRAETHELREQVRQSRLPEEGANLLTSDAPDNAERE